MRKTLDEIFLECHTDKASIHEYHAHDYGPAYECFFESRREEELHLLEIGVGGGQSIQSWLEYFPAALITGVDLVSDTNPWNTPGVNTHPRYQFFQGNQSDAVMWKCLRASVGHDFDIIIDDGSHFSGDIINTFKSLWPILIKGGFYCIEDLHVDQESSIFFTAGFPHHLDWLGQKIGEINHDTLDAQWLHCTRSLAIFKKKTR
jgi:hypothetical protein